MTPPRSSMKSTPARTRAFVAFEGSDGSGKSTAARAFVEHLEGMGLAMHLHPNRSYGPIRSALDRVAREEGFEDRHEMLGADTAYLIASAVKWRELLVLEERPTVPGQIVVADRYIFSHLALAQVWGANNGDLVRRLFDELPRPDMVFLLDVAPEVAAERVLRRGLDVNDVDFLTRFRAAFHALPEAPNFEIIDASLPPAEVAEQAVECFLTWLQMPSSAPKREDRR